MTVATFPRWSGAAALGALAAACAASSPVRPTIEARGGIAPNAEPYTYSDGSAPVTGGNDLEGRGFGVRATLDSPVVDLFVGLDQHRFGSARATEASVGLRKRYASGRSSCAYVEAGLRRGFDLETASGREDYDAAQAGVGLLVFFQERWFFDIACLGEWTTSDLDLDGGKDGLSGMVFHLGLGCSL